MYFVDMKAAVTYRVPLTSGIYICVPKPHELLYHLHPECSESTPASWRCPKKKAESSLEKFIFSNEKIMNSHLLMRAHLRAVLVIYGACASTSTCVRGFHGEAQWPSSPARGGEEKKEKRQRKREREKERGRPLFTEKQR